MTCSIISSNIINRVPQISNIIRQIRLPGMGVFTDRLLTRKMFGFSTIPEWSPQVSLGMQAPFAWISTGGHVIETKQRLLN